MQNDAGEFLLSMLKEHFDNHIGVTVREQVWGPKGACAHRREKQTAEPLLSMEIKGMKKLEDVLAKFTQTVRLESCTNTVCTESNCSHKDKVYAGGNQRIVAMNIISDGKDQYVPIRLKRFTYGKNKVYRIGDTVKWIRKDFADGCNPVKNGEEGTVEGRGEHEDPKRLVRFSSGSRLDVLPRHVDKVSEFESVKITDEVKMPLKLTVPASRVQFLWNGKACDITFELMAFTHHAGTLKGGHYYSYIRQEDDRWIRLDNLDRYPMAYAQVNERPFLTSKEMENHLDLHHGYLYYYKATKKIVSGTA